MTEHYKHEHKVDPNSEDGFTARRIIAGQHYPGNAVKGSGFPIQKPLGQNTGFHPEWNSGYPTPPVVQGPIALGPIIIEPFVEKDLPPDPTRTEDPAHGFLEEACAVMKQKAQLRDKPAGERSMEAIINTFNALTGKNLTESEGWEFMILLKMVRGRQGKYNRDDYVDGAAYFGLLGECESTGKKA